MPIVTLLHPTEKRFSIAINSITPGVLLPARFDLDKLPTTQHPIPTLDVTGARDGGTQPPEPEGEDPHGILDRAKFDELVQQLHEQDRHAPSPRVVEIIPQLRMVPAVDDDVRSSWWITHADGQRELVHCDRFLNWLDIPVTTH